MDLFCLGVKFSQNATTQQKQKAFLSAQTLHNLSCCLPTMALPENPFTSLGFCPTYGRTFQVFTSAPCTFIALTAVVMIPILAIVIPLAVLDVPRVSETGTESEYAVFVAKLTVQLVVYIAFTIIGKGAMIQVVAEIYAGHSPNWWACIKKTFHRLPTILCFTLIAALFVFITTIFPVGLYSASLSNPGSSTVLFILTIVAMVICTLWMILFWISVFAAMPLIMVEKKSALASIKRSYELSIGHRCYIFGTTAILMIITFVVIVLLDGPIGQVINIVLFPVHVM